MLDFLKRKPTPSIVPASSPAERSATFAPIEPQEPVAHGIAPMRSSIRTVSGSRPAMPVARMEPVSQFVSEPVPAPTFAPIEPLEPVAHQSAPMRPVVRAIAVEPEPVSVPPESERFMPEVHLVARDRPAMVVSGSDHAKHRSNSEMSEAKPRTSVLAETEPHHRMGRLDRVREEILARRPQLSPSQRALRTRPETTRDRYGRPTYVTYTVKSSPSREHTSQE